MASGTGEWQGNWMAASNSGAYRFVKVDSTSFNESTGVTTVNWHVGTYVSYGNFYGSQVTSWGSCSHTYALNGPEIYDCHYATSTVAHNGNIHFIEGCGYTSYSAGGWIQSALDVYWYPTLKTYTVAYNANGGSGAPGSQTKTWGTNLTMSSTKPTRTGYTFKGWATTQARANAGTVDKAAGGSYTTNAAVTFYAVWQINTWDMVYKANGGTGSDQKQTKTYNVNATVKAANTFSRTNFAFKRWNTNTTDSGTAYNAGASYTANAGVTLYAIWNRTVTYNKNTTDTVGSLPSAQTAIATSAITLSSNTPTRTNYVFKRWNTGSTDAGTAYNKGASYAANAGNVTLYAIWNPIISFNANGGTGAPESQTKTYGSNLTLSSTQPTRDGFSFKQWNTNSTGIGTAYAPSASFTSETATTLYAIWNATVTFDANGGSGAPASQTEAYGSTITLSSTAPTRPGHTFLEWNTEQDASGTAYQPGDEYSASNGNMTLYAKWRVDIVVTNIECKLTDAQGNPDALGHHVTVTASYDTTSSGSDCTYFGATLTVAGTSEERHAASPGATGTESLTFGPFAYDDLTPVGGTAVGTLTASNADGSIEFPLTTATTGYVAPNVISLVAYREEDGNDADDGTDLGIEIGWSVFQTRSQSIPVSIVLTLTDRATGAVTCTRTWTGITDNPAILHVVPTQDDVTTDGELLATAKNYVVAMTVSDAWKSATRTDEITVAYYTMDFMAGGHGAAFGKPSTREMLDVRMQAQFDLPIQVADQVSLPTYTFATLPQQGDIPTGPAFIMTEDDNAVYYYDGTPDGVMVGGGGGGIATTQGEIQLPLSVSNGGTGATNADDAISNLGLDTVSKYIDYGTTARDLNDVNINSVVSVYNPTNAPVANTWIDVVTYRFNSNSAYVVQVAYASGTQMEYMRFCSNGVWSSWAVSGGLKTETATTGFTINSTNVSAVTSQNYARYGNVVSMRIALTAGVTFTTNTNYHLGTVPSDFRPSFDMNIMNFNLPGMTGYLSSQGNLTVRANTSLSAINSGNTIVITTTFVV